MKKLDCCLYKKFVSNSPFNNEFTGPGGEQVIMYQRRTLSNITGTVTNNLVRPVAPGTTVVAAPQPGVIAASPGYPRPGHPATATPVMASNAPHYPRPHLFGHDSNIMC